MKKSKPKAKSLHRKTIVLIVTGSIAAYKACDLIKLLRDEGARVLCVMTEAAKQFVTPLVLRARSGEPVFSEFFKTDFSYGVIHTSLAEEADLVLVAPASANFIARLAAGFADDLASCTVLATRRPVIIVPAMNDVMYEHPLTQANMEKLKGIGYRFVEPIEGPLVCGKEGIGHIQEPSFIVGELIKVLKPKNGRGQD
jgi:phosphopantothenoylcysteine synthetase/decarboxylase